MDQFCEEVTYDMYVPSMCGLELLLRRGFSPRRATSCSAVWESMSFGLVWFESLFAWRRGVDGIADLAVRAAATGRESFMQRGSVGT